MTFGAKNVSLSTNLARMLDVRLRLIKPINIGGHVHARRSLPSPEGKLSEHRRPVHALALSCTYSRAAVNFLCKRLLRGEALLQTSAKLCKKLTNIAK